MSVSHSSSPRDSDPSLAPTHRDLHARSLAMHRVIAEKLEQDPTLLEHAKATLTRWRAAGDASTRIYDDEWMRVLQEGLPATLRLILDESEHGDALRHSSPFAGILTPRERFAFLRAWKRSHASSRP